MTDKYFAQSWVVSENLCWGQHQKKWKWKLSTWFSPLRKFYRQKCSRFIFTYTFNYKICIKVIIIAKTDYKQRNKGKGRVLSPFLRRQTVASRIWRHFVDLPLQARTLQGFPAAQHCWAVLTCFLAFLGQARAWNPIGLNSRHQIWSLDNSCFWSQGQQQCLNSLHFLMSLWHFNIYSDLGWPLLPSCIFKVHSCATVNTSILHHGNKKL